MRGSPDYRHLLSNGYFIITLVFGPRFPKVNMSEGCHFGGDLGRCYHYHSVQMMIKSGHFTYPELMGFAKVDVSGMSSRVALGVPRRKYCSLDVPFFGIPKFNRGDFCLTWRIIFFDKHHALPRSIIRTFGIAMLFCAMFGVNLNRSEIAS
jgi:hypothetical protein